MAKITLTESIIPGSPQTLADLLDRQEDGNYFFWVAIVKADPRHSFATDTKYLIQFDREDSVWLMHNENANQSCILSRNPGLCRDIPIDRVLHLETLSF